MVEKNWAAVDQALAGLHQVEVPDGVTTTREPPPPVPAEAPEFVRSVTAEMMAGRGDELPVSALPVDGTYPSGTTAYEKRNISELVAVWDDDTCIQCGNCSFVCPHTVIRSKYYDPAASRARRTGSCRRRWRPPGSRTAGSRCRSMPRTAPDAGCASRPARSVAPGDPVTKAINLGQREPLVAAERENIAFFETLPTNDRSRVDFGTVRGTQFLEPLFEFSGACAGCGETPVHQAALAAVRRPADGRQRDRMLLDLRREPADHAVDDQRGRPRPGMVELALRGQRRVRARLPARRRRAHRLARRRLAELRDAVGAELVDGILEAPQLRESELRAQRERVADLMRRLDGLDGPAVTDLLSVVDHLVRRSVWIVGGDGWAYDIGSGGLDHVLASGRNVNVLVLDTEVYSNTGGQMSKATPLGAVAKFAAAGKTVPKKDLALQAIAYGSVYVARVAMGADPQQTLSASVRPRPTTARR